MNRNTAADFDKLYPDLQPAEVLRYFYEISQIPRGSGNEQEMGRYLLDFAQKQGLKAKQDEVGNVILYKPASEDKQASAPVILQGHMDMVCVKAADSTHDFLKDPIEWRILGEDLYANHTTLGGDNGIAVAYALALLADQSLSHPPLEVLITVAEETGMDGAMAVKGEDFEGRRLLNIDSEEEGIFLTSCAGGCNLEMTLGLNTERLASQAQDGQAGTEQDRMVYEIQLGLSGLTSGHSGMEIHKQRGNALGLLALLSRELMLEATATENGLAGGRLGFCQLVGGSKPNAIPAAAEARFVWTKTRSTSESVSEEETVLKEQLHRLKTQWEQRLSKLLDETDPNWKLDLRLQDWSEEHTKETSLLVVEDSQALALINLLTALPHGVFAMDSHIPGLVRTSQNIGIAEIRTAADLPAETAQLFAEERHSHYFRLVLSVRSSLEEEKRLLCEKDIALASLVKGMHCQMVSDYPAWAYRANSALQKVVGRCYEDFTGRAPQFTGIHAGLECGLLSETMPDCDMISMGPNLYDVHTENEHMNLPSVARVWAFLKYLLAHMD